MRTEQCLNGWWDFLPVWSNDAGETPPRAGWLSGAYLVPSWWNKSWYAYRKRGEEWYRAHPDREATDPRIEDYEFLFDAYGYPSAWTNAKRAWIRRELHLPSWPPERRLQLVFDAIAARSKIYFNGHCVAQHDDAMLPCSVDVTSVARPGVNELAVFVDDYARDARGRTLTPSGNMMTVTMRGVWQDVWLRTHDEVHVSDVTIRTSTRTRSLEVLLQITNAGRIAHDVTCEVDVAPWRRGRAAQSMRRARPVGTQCVRVAAGGTANLQLRVRWPDAQWWDPAHPHLYWLRAQLTVNGQVRDVYAERFGFREVWVEGKDIMLNDHPVHLFSDWGHKLTPFHHTEQWIRQWFAMIKDAHMNHTRLHTHPHAPLVLRLADEEGILVTGETAIHGSSAKQAADDPAYWAAAREHVRRFVQRDKNHPALILWSVENEMRWNRDETNLTREELPKLRALFNELDPTRPAYHEGDSSLWDERTQPIISRHYNKECSGLGWWRQDRPLHAGEMAVYHYAGPNNTCHLGGDEVWADYRMLDRAAATDAALIIETGRTVGVCCFGPWNLSCLENLRPETRTQRLKYDDYAAPGVKPLLVKPHAAEFAFWRRGKGYTPFESFAIQAHAFRPLAVIDRSQRTQYFAGDTLVRELFVVNDTAQNVDGTLRTELRQGRQVLARKEWRVRVLRGRVKARKWSVKIPHTAVGKVTYAASFTASSKIGDAWERTLTIGAKALQRRVLSRTAAPIAVYGPGSLRTAWEHLGIACKYVNDLHAETLSDVRVLVLEAGTVTQDDSMREAVRGFASRGGRVIVLEQDQSLFPALPIEDKPVWQVFPRAFRHPVLRGIAASALAAWGDESYAVEGSAACVARKLYRKDGRQNVAVLLDADEGGFGPGGFVFAGLLEAPVGEGLVLACQLRISEMWEHIPAARQLLCNMLARAHAYRRPGEAEVRVCDGNDPAAARAAVRAAQDGARIIVNNATDQTLRALSAALGVTLRVQEHEPVYQLVRAVKDPVLNGVSNEDTCGIERFSYCSAEENIVVATRCLAPTRRLEPLLVTPTRSFLKELFVGDGRTEPLRAHTVTRCLLNVKKNPRPAVGLGRIRVGRGAIYINQFAPPLEKRAKFHTLMNRLWVNLGGARTDTILDPGPRVEPTTRGTGKPSVVWVLQETCDTALSAQLLQATQYTGERIAPSAVLSLARWAECRCVEGKILAEQCHAERPIWLYSRLWTPVARKNIALDIEVPNPAALTFLHVEGAGTLTLFINGEQRGHEELVGKAAVFPDLALEQGWNQVLLCWQPPNPAAHLRMSWQNISGHPETGFAFA